MQYGRIIDGLKRGATRKRCLRLSIILSACWWCSPQSPPERMMRSCGCAPNGASYYPIGKRRDTQRGICYTACLFLFYGLCKLTCTSSPASIPFHTCLGQVCYLPSMKLHRWFDNQTFHVDHQQHFQERGVVPAVLHH